MADFEDRSPADARPILIDALNLAYWCGGPPSLRIPLGLMAQLLASRYAAILYFDASAPYQLTLEVEVYRRLLQYSQHVREVRSGRRADGEILQHAVSSGACVLSRDRFRDYRKRYRRLIDDPARLIGGAVSEDRIVVPALAIEAPLPPTADAAWKHVESLLAGVNAAG